jgi:hypothetical protein
MKYLPTYLPPACLPTQIPQISSKLHQNCTQYHNFISVIALNKINTISMFNSSAGANTSQQSRISKNISIQIQELKIYLHQFVFRHQCMPW